MDLKTLLLELVFTSFGFFMIWTSVLQWLGHEKFKDQMEDWMQSAMMIVRICGILFVLHWLAIELITFEGVENSAFYLLGERYWAAFLIGWLLLPSITQMYWIKYWKNRRLPRIILAVSILLIASLMSGLYFDVTAINENQYVRYFSKVNMLFELIKNLAIFTVLTVVVNRVGALKNKPQQT